MTLIAVFTTSRPVLLSDVLLSAERSIIPATTPMDVPIDPRIYDAAPLRPVRFQQKTAVLHEGRIAVSVAGDFARATQAVCQLRDDARAGLVDQGRLESWCRAATERFRNVSLIIAWAEGPQWVVAQAGDHLAQKTTASGAVVQYTGSGTRWLGSSTVSLGDIVEQIGDGDEADRIIMQAIGQSGMQLFSERSLGVHDNFGGGCQITHLVGDRFYHVRDITYLHWSIFHDPKGAPSRMEFYPVVVRQRQQGCDLIFETMRFNQVECSRSDGWTEFRGRASRHSQRVAPLVTGTTPSPDADRLDAVSHYHVQRANYWKGSLVDFKASLMVHAGDVPCAIEIDTGVDESSVRVRSDVLMGWRRESRISKRWKRRERAWIAARAGSRTGG